MWQLRTNAKVESSPAVADGTRLLRRDRRAPLRRRRRHRPRSAGRTTPAGGSTRARRSEGKRICITTYAGSIFCLAPARRPKLWSTYVKRDSFRYESFYASASTDGERLFTLARSGKVVALDAVDGPRALDGRASTRSATRRRRVATRPDLRRRLQRGPPRLREANGRLIWQRARRRPDPRRPRRRRRPRLLLDARDGDVRGARLATGRSSGATGWASTRRGSRPSGTYYFSLNGMLVAFRGRERSPAKRPRRTACVEEASGAAVPAPPERRPRAKRELEAVQAASAARRVRRAGALRPLRPSAPRPRAS